MDTKDWILVIGPLVGVVVGGLITSFAKIIEVKHARKVAKEDAQLKRLEDISESLREVSISSNLWAWKLRVAMEALNEAEVHKILQESTDLCMSIASRVTTFVPSLGPPSGALLENAMKLMTAGDAKTFAIMRKGEIKTSEYDKAMTDYRLAMNAFIETSQNLSASVQKEIQTLIK